MNNSINYVFYFDNTKDDINTIMLYIYKHFLDLNYYNCKFD